MKNFTFCLLALFAINTCFAQNTIRGIVSNGDTALPWVNVYIKNTKTGTTSDDFGRFAIEAQKGDTLMISHIGFETKETLITDQKTLTVELEWNVLDEVVIIAQNIERVKIVTGNCNRTHNRYCCRAIGVRLEYTKPEEVVIAPSASLFPNPSSSGIFQLQLSDSYNNVQIFVNAMNGQQLQSRNHAAINNTISVDISGYPTGIYLINIIADGERLPAQKAIRS
ncbi:MAG: hypothetical protein ACI828_002107 [Flavobacteriales bacterium]|jgi:hypothetical protein